VRVDFDRYPMHRNKVPRPYAKPYKPGLGPGLVPAFVARFRRGMLHWLHPEMFWAWRRRPSLRHSISDTDAQKVCELLQDGFFMTRLPGLMFFCKSISRPSRYVGEFEAILSPRHGNKVFRDTLSQF
jgi:hypothetical protein